MNVRQSSKHNTTQRQANTHTHTHTHHASYLTTSCPSWSGWILPRRPVGSSRCFMSALEPLKAKNIVLQWQIHISARQIAWKVCLLKILATRESGHFSIPHHLLPCWHPPVSLCLGQAPTRSWTLARWLGSRWKGGRCHSDTKITQKRGLVLVLSTPS